MLRRLALVLLATLPFVCAFPAAFAIGAACPRGYHWVEVEVGSAGGGAYGSYSDGSTGGGYCAKDGDPPAGGDDSNAPGSINNPICLPSLPDADSPGVPCPESAISATVNLPATARSLAVQLRLPDTTPIFSPDPKKNEWGMLAVGFPVWLTTQGPRVKSTSASSQGLTFRLSATWRSTTFSMGDGSSVSCTAMTAYSASVKAGSPSPTCGHAYTKPSLPKGAYTVTATANWVVNWSVDGFSGSFPMSYSDSAQLRIGELQALNR